jgi:hypothetical protein
MALPRFLAAVVLLAFLLVAGPHPPALAQQPPEFSIQHRGWEGGAFANEEGQFSHCGVERTFDEEGVRFILSMDVAYQMNIALVNEGWTLEPDQRSVVQLSVDEEYRAQFPAVPVEQTVMVIPVGDNEELFRLLRQGRELTVQTRTDSFVFPLSGTSVAFGTVRQCIETANRLIEQNPDLTAAPPSAMPSDSRLSLRALAEILNRAGLEDLAFMRPEDVPDNELDLHHIWRIGEAMVGGLHQQPRGEEIRIDEFALDYVSRFEELCSADFEADLGGTTVLREIYALKSATVRCGDGEDADFVSLLFALDDLNYSVFFHQTRAANQQQAIDATEGVRQVVRSLAEESADGTAAGDGTPGGEGTGEGNGDAAGGETPAAGAGREEGDPAEEAPADPPSADDDGTAEPSDPPDGDQ